MFPTPHRKQIHLSALLRILRIKPAWTLSTRDKQIATQPNDLLFKSSWNSRGIFFSPVLKHYSTHQVLGLVQSQPCYSLLPNTLYFERVSWSSDTFFQVFFCTFKYTYFTFYESTSRFWQYGEELSRTIKRFCFGSWAAVAFANKVMKHKHQEVIHRHQHSRYPRSPNLLSLCPLNLI
jgi:hypothetical protein